MRRRNILKKVGIASSAAGASGLFMTPASAETFYEWCSSYIDRLTDAGLTDSEAHNYFEDVYNVRCDGRGGIQSTSSSSSSPFPFSACVPVSLFGEQYCLDTSAVQTDSNRSCGSSTRYLDAAVDITFAREKVDEGVYYDYQFWIGVRENPFTGNLCFEIGQESMGICYTTCTPSGDPTTGELADAMEDLMTWANEEIMNDEMGYRVLEAVIIICLIILIGLKCTLTGGAACS